MTYAADVCSGKDILSVKTPLIYPASGNTANSRQLDFKFRFVNRAGVSATTIVYIPGGPGIPATGLPLDSLYPAGFNLLYIDPRGIGCNSPQDDSERSLAYLNSIGFYRSEFVGSDILQAIRKAGVERNFIIYGASYGTLVATIFAKQAEDAGLTPKALLLEGVVGHSFGPTEYVDNLNRQWRRIFDSLHPNIKAAFNNPTPMGFAAGTWGLFIQNHLIAGGSSLPKLLTGLSQEAQVEDRDALIGQLQTTVPKVGGERHVLALRRQLFCREISEARGILAFNQGHFELQQTIANTDCSSQERMMDRYDAARYSLQRTPIFYFQGLKDPATPADHAQYHFNAQSKVLRTLFLFPNEGHNPLEAQVWNKNCFQDIYSEILNQSRLEKAVRNCVMDVSILSSSP